MLVRLLLLLLVLGVAVPAVAQSSQERHPLAQGFWDTWALGAGSTKPSALASDDGDTSYIIASDTVNTFDSYTFTAFDISASAITSVSVDARCKQGVGDDAFVSFMLRIDSTDYDSSNNGPTEGSYGDEGATWATNPCTTSAWTEAEVEGTAGSCNLQQFGVDADGVDATEDISCTELSVTVTYTEASSGATGDLLLLGVGR